ncbi:MAG: addiction module protein [Betaproteobacteria bacterium]|nr:addiction module protein [Betaproteobacteria bacterium]
MNPSLKALQLAALNLPIQERRKLVEILIASLDVDPHDAPEEIAKAWNEEIARRVADMEAGRTEWIPAEEVFRRIDQIINSSDR